MRKLNRGIAVGALSAPMIVALSGVAAAEDYSVHQTAVGPEVVSSSQSPTQSQPGPVAGAPVIHEQPRVTVGEDGVQVSGVPEPGEVHPEGVQSSQDGGLLDFYKL
jgi:hypothetical protein